MFQVVIKLKILKGALKGINKTEYGDISVHHNRTQQQMLAAQAQLHRNPTNVYMRQMESEARSAYSIAHSNYLSFLSQKAKITWIEGDDNTRMFHQSIKQRRIQNRINAIKNARGEWVESSHGVIGAFLDFYKDLLGSSCDTRKVDNKIVQQGKVLSTEQQQWLDLTFDSKEIKQAIFSIPNEKAPGIYGQEVIAVVQDFFRTGRMLQGLNVTTITLIPKIKCPAGVGDYRPIACYSVIYNAITKLICSRLSSILPGLISPNQGAFITGRSIMSNILLCQDLVKRFNKRQNLERGIMMKIDLRKAYDSVEWQFIEELLQALHFPPHFMRCIMSCITTPKFTLLINGSTEGFFSAKKGLRQGDPVSPLLFVIYMDYLTRILHYIGGIRGFKFRKGCASLNLNNLCFVDDLLMFCKGNAHSAYLLLQGLKLFSETSGLQANNAKSALYCSGINESEANRIQQFSGFSREQLPFRHFLWSGKAMGVQSGYINWEQVCSPKKLGGLGLRNVAKWNLAAAGKLV
ncbi:uncharacterized protein LOC125495593 [Beta vulgaris subsp. vulgaris]|uniref:uncharacterized protein LOC125495593 n=1 Tax=Beta vulgaris subsp. vulgaris TaxID=3555 RepID=UPI002036D55B|nr:uncharacterized protein LOC125495593 [Beta vulgaris subsp. vulgaris]